MVTQAINEDLLRRIQNYVKTDINSKLPEEEHIEEKDVYVLSFTRVLHNWKALVSTLANFELYYDITHDAELDVTLVNVYEKKSTHSAII